MQTDPDSLIGVSEELHIPNKDGVRPKTNLSVFQDENAPEVPPRINSLVKQQNNLPKSVASLQQKLAQLNGEAHNQPIPHGSYGEEAKSVTLRLVEYD